MAIPKIIHYCWMSGDPFPQDIQKCVDSWSEIMPDYELRLWNTENFDCNMLPYVAEAWDRRKYAFVSDIVRLHALYTEGGIYLDSDIEVLKRFDDLLDNPAFTGFESGNRIGPWLIASEKGNPLIKELLDYYWGRHFCDENGNLDMTPNTVPVTRILTGYGLKPINEVQHLPNITVYPEEYFCPKNPWTNEIKITDNTHAMHYFAGAWNDKASEEMGFIGDIDKNIRRFLGWRRESSDGSEIIIYGTGVVGLRCYECLCQEGLGNIVASFMVTKRDNSWLEIDGVPIKEVTEASPEDKKRLVLIGTNPKSHEAIGKTLKEFGFVRVYSLGN